MREISLDLFAGWMGSADRPPGTCDSVSIDSRKVVKGSLFFALSGSRSDGHDHLCEVAERGAVAAVVHRECPDAPLPLIRVQETTNALQEAASCYLRQVSQAKVAAITGSVGKTTVKEFTATLLGQKYRVKKSPGNQNSQVGLPLSLFEINGDEEWLILEMGLSGPGHIQRLIEIAPPEVALLTCVELTHSAFFENLDSIARAKGEIFLGPGCRLGIMCGEIESAETVMAIGTCPKISFSVNSPAADYLFDLASDEISIRKGNEEVLRTRWTLPGLHNRYNFCCAALLAHSCGVEWEEIVAGVSQLQLPKMRFEQVEKRGVTLINDAYNACERSMVSALDSLPLPKGGGKRIAVLSSMRELGSFSAACHQAVARHALDRVDLLICHGEERATMAGVWQEAGRNAVSVEDREELLPALQSVARVGDVVLVKGANSSRLWTIVEEF
jgi:UDP-N-acetylmuramoyl-tripeptide--D-alanyl-D-alanine ligase